VKPDKNENLAAARAAKETGSNREPEKGAREKKQSAFRNGKRPKRTVFPQLD